MISQLRKLVETEELTEIYTDLTDISSCSVGKVLKVSDDYLLLADISRYGKYDGYSLLKVEDVFQVNTNSQYIQKKMQKLYRLEAPNHIRFDVENENMLLAFLEFAQKHNFFISVGLVDSHERDVIGFIQEVNEDLLTIAVVDNYGEPDGEAYIELEDINKISCDDQDEACLKMLYNEYQANLTN